MPTEETNLTGTLEKSAKETNLTETLEMPAKETNLTGTLEIPAKETNLTGTFWTKGKCLPTMGKLVLLFFVMFKIMEP